MREMPASAAGSRVLQRGRDSLFAGGPMPVPDTRDRAWPQTKARQAGHLLTQMPVTEGTR